MYINTVMKYLHMGHMFGCKTAIIRPMQNIYNVQYKRALQGVHVYQNKMCICGYGLKVHSHIHNISSVLQASACNTDTTPTQPHRNSNTHRTKNNTTIVVIQQNSRKLLVMDILMSETC